MLNAYIFMKASLEGTFESIPEVLSEIRKIKGVKQAHAVMGPVDGIAYVEVEDFEQLGEILAAVLKVKGILSTDTRIAWPY